MNTAYDIHPLPNGTRLLICGALGLYITHIAVAIFLDRALYADGSNFFMGMLSGESGWPVTDDDKHIRLFVNLLNQFPLSLGISVGLDSLPIYRLLFGAGLFLTPGFILALCFRLSYRAKDYRLFLIASTSTVSSVLPSEIFILNQAITASTLAWLILHYMLLDIRLSRIDVAVIAASLLLLFRSHESMLIWGIIIATGSILRITVLDGRKINNKNIHVIFIGLTCFYHALFVAYWQLSHPVSAQTSAFLELLLLLSPLEMTQGLTRISFAITLVTLSVLIIAIFRLNPFGKHLEKALCAVAVGVGTISIWTGVEPFFNSSQIQPFREFEYRFLIPFGTAGWMSVVLIIYLTKTDFKEPLHSFFVTILSLALAGTAIHQLSNDLSFYELNSATRTVLSESESPIINPAEVESHLILSDKSDAYKYRWVWTWPLYGIALNDNFQVDRVVEPEGFEPYFTINEELSSPPFFPFIQFTQESPFTFTVLKERCREMRCLRP